MSANPYDPVTTTDSSQLADDDWGLSLPPIRYRNYSKTSRLKSVCFSLKQHPKCLLISAGVVVGIILLSVIIAVASHDDGKGREPTGNEPKWMATDNGVEFYPVPADGTIVVSFNPNKFYQTKDQPIEKQLNKRLLPYKAVSQIDSPYTECNGTYNPSDKVCRIPTTVFGAECTKEKHYGYFHGQPCILLQLVLPDDRRIAPLVEGSPLWDVEAAAAHKDISYDPDNVLVTCQGVTDADSKLLQGRGRHTKPFEIYPAKGFPSFIYRPRLASLPHIKPAVMVRLPSLLDGHLVQVSCTVWGALYDFTGKMTNKELIKTNFAVYIDR